MARLKVAANPTVVAALEGLCKAVLKDTPVPVPAEDGLRSLMVVDACHKSAEAGGTRVAIARKRISMG